MIEVTYYLLAQLQVRPDGCTLERFVISQDRMPKSCPPGTVWAEIQTVTGTSHDRAKETLKHYLDPFVAILAKHAQRTDPSALGIILTP